MFRRIVALIVCVAFISTNLHYSYAQGFNINQLPVPGKMVEPAANYVPLTLKGLVLHPEDALKFDFLMDTGNTGLQGDALKSEALKVMTYFLTSLTMKEDDMWVNLSPYEQGKVIENKFGNTVMGRDLLAEDYVLKQLTSSLVYPERELGQTFWKELYSKVDPSQLEEISIETINKVWIVPSEAVVWEHDGKVMIIKSHLRVMLDEDFVALKNSAAGLSKGTKSSTASQIVRDVVLPVLEKQVNEGEHFAQLRQMYQAMILATWYKKALKENIIARVYADQGKIKGVDNPGTGDIEAIYQQYLEAFKKGAFNYIKEDVDAKTGEIIPRKYFSGGFTLKMGIISLATALSIWSGTPTPVQAAEISQSAQPVGTTVLVQGSAAEADGKGQPIILAQGKSQVSASTTPPIQSNELTKEEIWNFLIRASKDRLTGLGQLIQIGKPAIPVLREGLRANDRGIRWASVTALGEIGDESIILDLLEMLKSEGYQINIPSAASFKKLDQTTITSLVGVLESKDSIQSDAAVIILKGINDKRTIPLLLETLKSEAWYVRRSSAKVLIKVGDKSAVPGLLEALNRETHLSVNYLIPEALAQIGDKSVVPTLLAALKKSEVSRKSIIKALGKLGDKTAIPGLLELLKAESWDIRMTAAEVLGQFKDNRAVPGLIGLLKDNHPEVLQATVEALLNFRQEAYPDLMRAIVTSYSVYMAVVKSGERAMPFLMEALKDNSPAVRLSALRILERMNVKNVTPELVKSVSDSNQDVRRTAVNILSAIGDKTVIPDLLNAVNDTDYQVATLALQAITKIATAEGLPVWLEVLRSNNENLRSSAINALAKIGQPAVPTLIEILKSGQSWERKRVALALGEIGDRRAINPLQKALSDNDWAVQKSAAIALDLLQANWWQRRSNSQQWLLILLASGIGVLGGLGFIGYLKSADHKKKVINKLILDSNINEIINFLNDGDALVREEARKALDALVRNSEVQYQLGLEHLEGRFDNRGWAIGMLAKSRKNSAVNHIAIRLNDNSLKEAARKALDLLLIDSKSQYQMGFDHLENNYIDNKVWAIAMLAKSRDSRVIGHIVKFIDRDLLVDDDYQLFNAASDALYAFGDARSEYKYVYYPEERHQESYDGPYGEPSWSVSWVVDKEAYWERVRRENALKTEIPVASVKEKWPTVDLVSPPEVNRRLQSSLENAKVEPARIADDRLRRFMEFLKTNKLGEIVIVGGAVRDAVAGDQVNDFDLTVKVPLAIDEKGALKPLSRETYQKAEAILARLANALGVTVEQIKDDSDPVKFEGVPIQYLGPGITNGVPGVVINSLIIDQNTGDVEVGFTGAEILFMGMDSTGQLFGHKRALENWLNGRIVLKGDLKEGHNMGPLMVLKILRLRHQFGLAISDVSEKLMRKALEDSRKNQIEPQLLSQDIAAVIGNAMDKDKARQELVEWGFVVPNSQGPQDSSNRNRLVGIGAMAAILSLGSAVPTDAQAAQFIDVISNLPEYFSRHQQIIPLSLAAFVGVFLGIGYVLIKWNNYKEKLIERKLADIQKYTQLNQPNRIIELLDDNDSRVRAAAKEGLSKLNLDSETQYRLGAELIDNGDSTDKIWAISMLVKSQDRRIIEPIAKVLEGIKSDDDYELYNVASNALFSLGDPRGQFVYEFQPAELYEDFLLHGDTLGGSVMRENKPAYWTKVKRTEDVKLSGANQKPDELGGIALDSRMMDLQIKRDGNGIPLPVSQQPLDEINIQGFVPQIINIQTINLIEYLGLNLQKDQALAKI